MNPLFRRRLLPLLALALLALVSGVRAQTATPTVLYTFHYTFYDVYVNPLGTLAQDAAGNFYGTTQGGGDYGYGSVYRITAAGAFTNLYSFRGTADGSTPSGALLLYTDGNLYGTTFDGGQYGFGTVFSVTTGGALTTLHSFDRADGRNPRSGLVSGGNGFLYGTTTGGGAYNTGTVYAITPAGALTTLHSFIRGEGTAPQASLVRGTDGNFYGTTAFNGSTDSRTDGPGGVFRIASDGTFQTLHLFSGPTDGFGAVAGLVQGSDGAFYGANPQGGANGNGTLFRVAADGTFNVIYTFSQSNYGYNNDGIAPLGTLLDGGNGLLYGNTNLGGTNGTGTVFSVTTGGTLTTLYTFSALTNDRMNTEGANPYAGFVRGTDGRLYAPISAGGATDDGTVVAFNLTGTTASFFNGQVALSNGVYYLAFPNNGNIFGYYSYLSTANYIYHFDLGYEYVFDAADGKSGVYLYDFQSGHFFYTSPTFPFPYLYDFTLNSVLYYFPNTSSPGRYTSNPRYFYDFATGKIITQ